MSKIGYGPDFDLSSENPFHLVKKWLKYSKKEIYPSPSKDGPGCLKIGSEPHFDLSSENLIRFVQEMAEAFEKENLPNTKLLP